MLGVWGESRNGQWNSYMTITINSKNVLPTISF